MQRRRTDGATQATMNVMRQAVGQPAGNGRWRRQQMAVIRRRERAAVNGGRVVTPASDGNWRRRMALGG